MKLKHVLHEANKKEPPGLYGPQRFTLFQSKDFYQHTTIHNDHAI